MKRNLPIALALLALLASSQAAYAQEVGYSVSPSLVQLKAYNSTQMHGVIRITNLHQQPLTLSYSFMPVKQSSLGDGNLLPAPVTPAYLNLFRHVQLDFNGKPLNTLQLQGLQSESLSLSINIPQQSPRDYYFSILFTPVISAPINSSSSTIQPSLGTTILVSHSPVTKPASITSFSTNSFYIHGPITFNLEVSNPNSTLSNAQGAITIHSLLGQRIAVIPLDNALLLQGNMRNLTSHGEKITWPENWLLGVYTAKVSVVSNNDLKTSRTIHFTVVPLFTLIIITVFTALVIGIAVKIWRKS